MPSIHIQCHKLNLPSLCRPIIDQILEDPDAQLRYVIADLPERLSLKGFIGHGGRYACEFCPSRASTKPIRWPHSSTFGRPYRTPQTILQAAR